jgi:hypothetical protein
MPWNNEKTANVTAEIIAERRRQVDTEGWTEEHDDKHDGGELARAGACYALQAATGEAYANTETQIGFYRAAGANNEWPWDTRHWKPKNPRRDLIVAAALLIAEIERLDRQSEREDHHVPAL